MSANDFDSRNGHPPSVFRLGTAGWAYADWSGCFYPVRREKGMSDLRYYSRFFDFVEINSTFYRIMAPRLAEKWAEEVQSCPGFLFGVKLWQGLTHERPDALSDGEIRKIRSFCDVLHHREQLGALLIQFPWSFRNCEENRSYLARLLDRFQEYPCAVEVRHSGWDCREHERFLLERDVAFCNIDQPLLHDCLRLTSHATPRFSYLRLHGRNSGNWFRETDNPADRYDYLYDAEELESLAEIARALARQSGRVFVSGNNHWRAQAACNALMLHARLTGSVPRIPAPLLETYPELRQVTISHHDDQEKQGDQLDLF